MKLFIQSIQSAPQVVVDYLNAMTNVTRYATAVSQARIPTLVVPPANYGDYANTFASAKIHVGLWLTQAVPSVAEIPNAFFNLDNILETQLDTVEKMLNALLADPGNKQLVTNIQQALKVLQQEISTADNGATGLIKVVNNYRSTISPDATALSNLCTQIAAAEKVDAAQIAQLKAVVQNLQDIVDDRNKIATLDIITDVTITIFLSVAGTAVGLPFATPAGAIVGTLFGIATGVASDFLPINGDLTYQQTVADLQTEMDSVNNEIGVMNTVVGQLETLNDTFSQIVNGSGVVETQCGVVTNYWQKCADSLTVAIGDLYEALLDPLSDSSTINAAIADVQAARAAWKQTLAILKPIQGVQYNFESGIVSAEWPTS